MGDVRSREATTADLEILVGLSRTLGEPQRDFAILGEGNTSMRIADDRMLVKASGASLRTAGPDDFVEVGISRLVELVEAAGAAEVASARGAVSAPGAVFTPDAVFTPGSAEAEGVVAEVEAVFAEVAAGGRRPSVEAMLHAVCLASGASVVGHTHPVAVNAILCSPHAEQLATDVLFPDQVVVLGAEPLFFPYLDPGLALARAVHHRLATYRRSHEQPPRVMYLANHGLVALGRSPGEVVQITEMAVKAARILSGAIAAGGARPLPVAEVARIDGRPDEAYRRAVLAQAREGDVDNG